MGFGYLAKTPALLSVVMDALAVQFQGMTSDVSAFELGAPHAGTHPLDDQATFQFSDRPDDDHDGPPQRSTGVDLLAEADKLDVQPIQIV